MVFLPGAFHSFTRRSARICLMPSGASSPSWEQANVGVVPRKPESVTSSTVSPMLSTRVALTKDTMIPHSSGVAGQFRHSHLANLQSVTQHS
ncbi:hypothetical protein E2C01_075639 [Portunus trituberculatus]|uniref:Uncharacterized protein n=1 Tax=Portunus trituberculatus TaxID=210409 RepID=A0A5B7IGM9_PORTR|nr:hypothetical protein [Portunus trituberculatus]